MQRTTALIRYRASDSVPERTDRTRRYPIPPRHPHRKIRKSGDKNLSPLFRIRFFSRRDSGLHLRKERQKLGDGIRLRTLPLRPQRPPPPVVFSPVVFPINAFPDDASADFNAFFRKIPANIPFSVRLPHDDNRKTGHLVSSHDDPADRTPRIAARREARPTGSHRTTGRNEESILPKALTNPSGHAGRPHREKREPDGHRLPALRLPDDPKEPSGTL